MTDNSLERFRRSAKILKAGYESGSPDALTRITMIRPRNDGADLKHADYLHVIARESNFASWPAMKAAIGTLGVDRAQRLQWLKTALHAGQAGIVANLLADTPDLAAGHFGLLCALYDVQSARAMLHDDSTCAVTAAGPYLPLVQLCRSRMFKVWPDSANDAIAIAEMLVANGADVNEGNEHAGGQLSRLYWAMGDAGHSAYAFAAVFGSADLVARLDALDQASSLTDMEQMLAQAAKGNVGDGFIDTDKLSAQYRGTLREILHLLDKLPHLKALVAIVLELGPRGQRWWYVAVDHFARCGSQFTAYGRCLHRVFAHRNGTGCCLAKPRNRRVWFAGNSCVFTAMAERMPGQVVEHGIF